jgi:trk system potassium uptake protein TrkH
MIAAVIGGCGGSTSGGIKVIRAVISVKQSLIEVKRLIHPHSVLTLKLGKNTLPTNLAQAVWSFVTVFLALTILFTILLLSQGLDLRTAYSAVIASIANAGAALGDVSSNFESLNHFSKWVLVIAMLAGRLEIFTLLVLLTPSFWRK